MKSSDSSSAKASPPPSGTPPRKAFALSGRSVSLDPLTHAVRPDLADVRLADRIFAPHYAEAMPCRFVAPTTLRADRDPSSSALATLGSSDPFELLDVIGDDAWGVAPGIGLVGYVPAAMLAP